MKRYNSGSMVKIFLDLLQKKKINKKIKKTKKKKNKKKQYISWHEQVSYFCYAE